MAHPVAPTAVATRAPPPDRCPAGFTEDPAQRAFRDDDPFTCEQQVGEMGPVEVGGVVVATRSAGPE